MTYRPHTPFDFYDVYGVITVNGTVDAVAQALGYRESQVIVDVDQQAAHVTIIVLGERDLEPRIPTGEELWNTRMALKDRLPITIGLSLVHVRTQLFKAADSVYRMGGWRALEAYLREAEAGFTEK